MAEEVTTGGEKVKETKGKEKAPQDVESQIKTAMRSRVAYFKEQADSLTFEGVRRLLEKDLGMETYALDVHKRFIKQCLVECLESSDDDNVSKNSCETEERTVCSAKGEAAESSDRLQPEKDVKEPRSEDEKMEDSPVFGLLTGNKTTKPKVEACQGIEDKGAPDENMIRKALMKRVSYFRANSQKITMAEVRRLLEQDLELDKNSLDPYKKLISELVEKILESPKAAKVNHEKSSRKSSKESSGSSNNDAEEDEEEDSSNSDGEEEEEEEVKPKKRITPKGKASEGLKKRQRQEETKVPRKKQKNQARAVSEKNSDSDDGGIVSEDGGDLRSSMENQKKEAAAPAYGKRVEHLKSVIKSCGMSVPPSVYRRVKQAPENKREAHLIKELEEILSKEGLSANPSEKEIKEVKRKKERARELEGIDTSNIVSTSRRRSTTTFVATPKPKVTEESDEVDESDDESDNEDDDDEEDNDDGNEDNDEDEGDDGDDESQSEDNEDNDDDSD